MAKEIDWEKTSQWKKWKFLKKSDAMREIIQQAQFVQLVRHQWYIDKEFRKDCIRLRNALLLHKLDLDEFWKKYYEIVDASVYRKRFASPGSLKAMKKARKKKRGKKKEVKKKAKKGKKGKGKKKK